jgi:hypothetical protein
MSKCQQGGGITEFCAQLVGLQHGTAATGNSLEVHQKPKSSAAQR